MKFFTSLATIMICTLNFFAQVGKTKYIEFVEAPRDVILQVIAVQPNCPIKFENPRFLFHVGGGVSNSYELRNIGSKPIRSVTVASSMGAENTYSRESGVLAMPGQLVPMVCKDCREDRIIPLTDELREKLNLKPPMRSFVTLMVIDVEFTDGTRFNDQKTYDALRKFVDKLDDALRLSTTRAKPVLKPQNYPTDLPKE